MRANPDRHTARPRLSGPQPEPSRPIHPAIQLEMDAATLRRIEANRPWLVAQALLTGAPPEQVLDVLGWELDELRFAIGRWAPKLRKQGQLTDGQSAALLATVSGDQQQCSRP